LVEDISITFMDDEDWELELLLVPTGDMIEGFSKGERWKTALMGENPAPILPMRMPIILDSVSLLCIVCINVIRT
jgi:hypothetical protein